MTSEVERFWSHVDKTASGCWEWRGSRDHHGYGAVGPRLGTRRAHRIAYEWLIGPVPDGLVLDHLCRNRACVNPDHLEPVTDRENLSRGRTNMTKTHCPKGHEYTPENTLVRAERTGRQCRTCKAEWQRVQYADRHLEVSRRYKAKKRAEAQIAGGLG